MAARRKHKQTEPAASLHDDQVLRTTNTVLNFREYCGQNACRRRRGCAGDAKACFDRWWPAIPARTRVEYRAFIMALSEGHTTNEAFAAADAEGARYDAFKEATERATGAASPLAPRSGERMPSECEAGEGQNCAKPLTRHPHAEALGCYPLPASQGEGKERRPRLRTL